MRAVSSVTSYSRVVCSPAGTVMSSVVPSGAIRVNWAGAVPSRLARVAVKPVQSAVRAAVGLASAGGMQSAV